MNRDALVAMHIRALPSNLMFHLDISLFMLNMCNTIIRYFDCSHVSIEFLCIHICMSFSSLLVLRTKVSRKTGLWWMYRLKSGNTEGIRGLGYEQGYEYINRHRNTGVY